MKNSPFFSVLIPTKNRSHLVSACIRSVLQQSYRDFEVIVCDNDDDAESTKEVVRPLMDDPRVTYLRTGGLDMVANWNSALASASGRYITVLEDKMIFYPGALAGIRDDILSSKSGVLVWETDVLEDTDDSPTLILRESKENQLLSSSVVLQKVVSNVFAHWHILPRGLCCVVPKALIEKSVSETGRPFYEPISPDFTSAIKVLSLVDGYVWAGKAYTMVTSNKASNGRRILRRESKDHNYFLGRSGFSLNTTDAYIDSEWVLVNLVVADYIKLQKAIGGGLKRHDVSGRRYFEMLFREFLLGLKTERRLVWTYSELWQLFYRGDGLLKNMLYAWPVVFGRLWDAFERKGFKRRGAGGVDRLAVKGKPQDFVLSFLNGEFEIRNRGKFELLC